jgi:hypothetical protein
MKPNKTGSTGGNEGDAAEAFRALIRAAVALNTAGAAARAGKRKRR